MAVDAFAPKGQVAGANAPTQGDINILACAPSPCCICFCSIHAGANAPTVMQWRKCAKPMSRRRRRKCAYRNSLNALERIIRWKCMNCTCSCDKGHWAKDKGTVRHPVCLGLPVCHTACTKHMSHLSNQHTLPELCFTYAQLHSALEALVNLRWRHTT